MEGSACDACFVSLLFGLHPNIPTAQCSDTIKPTIPTHQYSDIYIYVYVYMYVLTA